ncbi:MAG: DUF29 domain-containing protein [Aquificaceae bacterium]
MKTISKEELRELYDKDFPLWAEINLELLREKLYDLVDWENLLEEIEDMARSDLKACVSHLAVILEHLYKWDNFKHLTRGGKEKGGLSWIKSIENARLDIWALLEKYPSLRAKLPSQIEIAWIDAKKELVKNSHKLGLSLSIKDLPETCPYTYEEAMQRDLRKEIEP